MYIPLELVVIFTPTFFKLLYILLLFVSSLVNILLLAFLMLDLVDIFIVDIVHFLHLFMERTH